MARVQSSKHSSIQGRGDTATEPVQRGSTLFLERETVDATVGRSEPAQQVALALPPTPADDPDVQPGPGRRSEPVEVRPLVHAGEEVSRPAHESMLGPVRLSQTSVLHLKFVTK